MTRINMGESMKARLHNIAKAQGSELDSLIVRFAFVVEALQRRKKQRASNPLLSIACLQLFVPFCAKQKMNGNG